VAFEALFDGKVTIYDLVITFMALLEMAKRRLVRIYQADPHSPIHLRSTVLGEDGEAGTWSDDAAAREAPSEPEAAAVGPEASALESEPAAEAQAETGPESEPAEPEVVVGHEAATALEPEVATLEPEAAAASEPEWAAETAEP